MYIKIYTYMKICSI